MSKIADTKRTYFDSIKYAALWPEHSLYLDRRR